MPSAIGRKSDRSVPPSALPLPPSSVKVTAAEPLIHAKPVDPRRRRDLLKIVEKARQMAADGQGKLPRYLAPVAIDARARRQYSFSRLTGMLHARTVGAGAEAFDADATSEPPFDARGLGTLVHAVLEEVDFAAPGDVEDLVRRLAEQHLPQPERGQEISVAVEMIGRFLASPRASQLAARERCTGNWNFCWRGQPIKPRPVVASMPMIAPMSRRCRPTGAICKGLSTVCTATPPEHGGWSITRQIA